MDKKITLLLPEEQYEKIRKHAYLNKCNQSYMLRLIIDTYLQYLEEKTNDE